MEPVDLNDRLEHLVARVLREQPGTAAPAGLAERVRREIERRERRSWWQRSLAHWPLAAQLGFLVASVSCAALLWWLFARARPGSLGSPEVLLSAPPLAGWSRALGELEYALRALAPLAHAAWLYEGLAFALSLYAVLFALLATAYVTLWRRPYAGARGARP